MTKPITSHRDNKHRKRRLPTLLVQGVFVVLVLFAVHLYQVRNVASGPAPQFEGQLLDGTPVSLGQFRGRPLLLQFWATWCPVCDLEQGSIHRLARDHQVLSVALDELSVEGIRQWMTGKGVDYPVIRDPRGLISTRYGVNGVPASIIIDPDGRIRFVEVGYTTELGLRLRLWWAGR